MNHDGVRARDSRFFAVPHTQKHAWLASARVWPRCPSANIGGGGGFTGSEAADASVDRTLVLVRRGRVVDAEIEAAQAACRREKSSLASRAAGRRAAEGSDSAGMP